MKRSYVHIARSAAAVGLFALLWPASAPALSTVSVVSAGDGTYQVQGTSMNGVSALEIDLAYDTSTLAKPQVSAGSLVAGAMMETNTDTPGTVRIVMIRLAALSGSGVISTVTFDRNDSGSEGIRSLSARMADINGSLLPVQTQISPSTTQTTSEAQTTSGSTASTVAAEGQTVSSTAAATTKTASTTETSATTAPVVFISLPAAGPAKQTAEISRTDQHPGDTPAETMETSAASKENNTIPSREPAPQAVVPSDKQMSTYAPKSMLDRIKDYSGPRTAEALLSLFTNDSLFGCKQIPPAAISDGRSSVQIRFVTTPGAGMPKDVAVLGARLISLTRDPDRSNSWIADVVPERGTYQASLALSQDRLKMIIPLVVSPMITVPAHRSGSSPDAYLEYYRAGRRMDLNNDGKLDYLDDYVFAVNYLNSGMNRGQKTEKSGNLQTSLQKSRFMRSSE